MTNDTNEANLARLADLISKEISFDINLFIAPAAILPGTLIGAFLTPNGTWYLDKPGLVPVSVGVRDDGACELVLPLCTWTAAPVVDPGDLVLGWWCTGTTSGKILAADLFPSPVDMTVNGNYLNLVPKIIMAGLGDSLTNFGT